ncbi:Protein GAST1 [Capsicum annuum]|uniref:Protein GAST1 n=1 Tax=Capsicum annuum TaxID=4072 RepID=A0A2G2Y1I5_CAPAN|nr:Protein GAST1 [Capsicum annuum]
MALMSKAELSKVQKPPFGSSTCPVPNTRCGVACHHRCSATSHKKTCLFYCNKCCQWCKCVPPGTNGNKGCCSCYNNWHTKRGGPKCP